MDILKEIEEFYFGFEGQKGVLGKSFLGKPVYLFTVQKTCRPKVIIQYSIHAREYITAYLALKHIERFENEGKVGTVYFIPMLNPDGVEIALNGKPLYKANARGVDLNVNFDAHWGTGEKNKTQRGDENYIGEKPFSEKETKLLRDFTLSVKPDATISYHAKGEEIYWEFNQDKAFLQRDFDFANRVALETGYTVKLTPNSAGGYKDWCIEKLKIPALTIEVGSDELSHPIGKEWLDQIYLKNERVPEVVTEYLTGEICK